MDSKPCGKCGKSIGKGIIVYCPHCGNTQWGRIVFGFFIGLVSFLFGAQGFYSLSADLPSSGRVVIFLVSVAFAGLGLVLLVISVKGIRDSVNGRRTKKFDPGREVGRSSAAARIQKDEPALARPNRPEKGPATPAITPGAGSSEKIPQAAAMLHALSNRVARLSKAHPQSSTTAGGSVAQAQKQIPWICRELDAAADALLTGQDPFGKAITRTQVSNGLKKLAEYVRNPDYGTLMELVYPGIDPPLQACMDELETILRKMKGEEAVKRPRSLS